MSKSTKTKPDTDAVAPTSTSADDAIQTTGDIQVIGRAAALLRMLVSSDGIDVNAAAKSLGIGRSSAHRYLASMERHDLLARRDRATYEVGTLMTQLGAVALARSGVIRTARPVMRDLRDEVKQTVTLALWDGSTAVVAHVVEDTSRTAHVTVQVGRALSADSAQTTVFRAFVPDGARSRAPRPAQLDDDVLEEVRRSRIVVRDGLQEGLRAVAVPIMDASGRIAATLAVVGIAQLVPDRADSDLAVALQRASAAVTVALGARAGADPLEDPG